MGGKDELHIDPQAKSRKHFEDTKEALKENLHDVKETCNDTADQIKAKFDKKEEEKGFWESAGEKLSNAATSVKEAVGWQEPPPPTPTERMKEKLTDFKEACSDQADRVKDKFKSEDEKKAEKSYLDSAGEKLSNAATSAKEAVGWQEPPPPTFTERMKEKLSDLGSSIKHAVGIEEPEPKSNLEVAQEKFENAAGTVKDTFQDGVDSVRSGASSLKDSAERAYDSARDGVTVAGDKKNKAKDDKETSFPTRLT